MPFGNSLFSARTNHLALAVRHHRLVRRHRLVRHRRHLAANPAAVQAVRIPAAAAQAAEIPAAVLRHRQILAAAAVLAVHRLDILACGLCHVSISTRSLA